MLWEACNFVRMQGTNKLGGRAFVMYSTIALANYAVETLNDRYFKEATVDCDPQETVERQVQLVQLPHKALACERAYSGML